MSEQNGQLLSRDAIKSADDRVVEQVPVPEWGGEVLVRSLSGKERDHFESSIVQQRGNRQVVNMKNARARLVVLSVVDANGDRMFGDADIAWLTEKSAAALQRVFNVAQRLSGITDEDLEEMKEDFGEGPTGSSPSDSPSPAGEPTSTAS